MLAAVPGCGMCVSAFERGFEPSSSELMWGEVKHNPAAGPAPRETADPVLNESQPFEVERGCCLGPAGDCAETLPSQSFPGGVFCKVAAPSPRAFSEEDVRLPFCN